MEVYTIKRQNTEDRRHKHTLTMNNSFVTFVESLTRFTSSGNVDCPDLGIRQLVSMIKQLRWSLQDLYVSIRLPWFQWYFSEHIYTTPIYSYQYRNYYREIAHFSVIRRSCTFHCLQPSLTPKHRYTHTPNYTSSDKLTTICRWFCRFLCDIWWLVRLGCEMPQIMSAKLYRCDIWININVRFITNAYILFTKKKRHPYVTHTNTHTHKHFVQRNGIALRSRARTRCRESYSEAGNKRYTNHLPVAECKLAFGVIRNLLRMWQGLFTLVPRSNYKTFMSLTHKW